LFGYVIRAYWRCGLWRWFATFRRYDGDLHVDPPSNALMIGGCDDPLPDREFISDLQLVPGAHACHFANPDDVASVVLALAPKDEFLGGVAANQDDKRDSEADQRDGPLTGAARDAK